MEVFIILIEKEQHTILSERESYTHKKRNKIILWLAIILSVGFFCFLAGTTTGSRLVTQVVAGTNLETDNSKKTEAEYQEGLDLMQQENYIEAIPVFAGIDYEHYRYIDGVEKIHICASTLVNRIDKLYQEKKYEKAYELLRHYQALIIRSSIDINFITNQYGISWDDDYLGLISMFE